MINTETAGIIVMLIGLYGLISKDNPIKQVLSINVISLGLVLFFIGAGYVEGGDFPIMPSNSVDPLPATLMLTTLVVDVAITALALAMILRIGREWT
ncbi:multisubunit sodium/hydrogen antiporter, MnhC subunit [Thermococcus kodakarensis KOD1]|uniref:Multisubunit sodium/hydrogen antiporter, MnhC subunit n=1 Tax=Thermococcus kodakarensis (strain ATCC BAA-918 / JCM 12380 / KOD1) TaxID=69014 RepID=Q5JDL8_THEKO|nr:cation:proton antiporter subunit C [Thermococcus kodakarensis]WCN28669.1 cation:proton antiporter subunit C [Thermococcus kodakarensis]WCN30967.1 cation:proton antiporter subunit C [Thermococcus kodakarensis]BAD84813.1 multisubunit sodium/hydrogen antiporter, MnhC subunit [Thermococcus kodakarensis KOD1]